MVFGLFASTADEIQFQARLRYGFCPPTAAIDLVLQDFKGALSAACGRLANGSFLVFGHFGLGFRWCLAFSDPLPTSFIQSWSLVI